jgi:hypothetical protein
LASHHLEPSVKACHQGYLETTLKPVPTVASGDAVTIDPAREAADAVPGSEWFHIQCAIQALHPMIAKKHVRV